MPRIVRASDRDFIDALHETRAIDREEAELMTRRSWAEALTMTFETSTDTYSFRVDGKWVALFGVCPLRPLEAVGCPWMVGSERVNEHSRAFLRRSCYALKLVSQEYAALENVVWAENHASVRWLAWLGFEIHPPFMMNGAMFHRFDKQCA